MNAPFVISHLVSPHLTKEEHGALNKYILDRLTENKRFNPFVMVEQTFPDEDSGIRSDSTSDLLRIYG